VKKSRIRAVIIATAVGLAVGAALTGCAGSTAADAPSKTSVTKSLTALNLAKAQTIATENAIAGFVPKDKVVSSQVTSRSAVIFPCTGQTGRSYWPGTLTANLEDGVDTATVLSNIAQNWTSKTGWSVYKATASDGSPSLDIKSAAGSTFTVQFAQGPVFTVTSLSSCFNDAGLAGKTSY
jgi:hypothetical protein